jgi:hypothetical protein
MPISKEAHSNREALKKASRQQRVPNLLLTRLERQQARRAPGPFWPVWLVFIVLFAVLAFILRKNFKTSVLPPNPAGTPTATAPLIPGAAPVVPTASPETPGTAVENAAPPTAVPAVTPAPAVPTVPPPAPTPPPPAATSAEPAAPAPSSMQWKGFSSPIKKYREVIIDNEGAWAELWKEMGQAGAAPAINFAEASVVGIFLGDSPQGSEIVLLPPHEFRRSVRIAYRATTPTGGAPNATQPFHLKVISRSDKPIRFVPVAAEPALTPATTEQR